MKRLITLAASLGLLQCAGASALHDADFDDAILQGTDATGGSGGAGPSRIYAWYANSPVGDTCSWYRETNLTGPDEQTEPLARYRDPSTSSSIDTRGLIQIISNSSGRSGVQPLTFSYLLNDADVANGNPHILKLRIEVFGINSAWSSGYLDLADPNTSGNLSSADSIPAVAYTVLLNSADFTKTTEAVVSNTAWREASFHIDFGAGYDRVAVRFTASNGTRTAAGTTTDIAIDKVILGSSEPTTSTKHFQVLANSPANLLDVLRGASSGVSLTAVTQPAKGSASLDGDGASYIPNTAESGMDAFSCTTSENETINIEIDIRTRPNFLFILTDDQGWTTMEGQADKNRPDSKSDYHITPNLTRLASSGMRFSRGYAPAPNCSPYRYAILTGKSCVRLGFTDIVGRNASPLPNTSQLMISPGKKVDAIQASDTTIAELLKTLPTPYATAHWGKWHLNGGGPSAHGFDESDGATGNDTGDAGGTQNADPKLVYSPLVHYTPHYVLADGKDQRPSVALHEGDYKLVIEFEQPTLDGCFNLYHLGSHIGEDEDLSESEIAVRWRMWVRLRDYMKEVQALYPLPDPDNWPGSDGINDGDADNDGIPDLVEMRELLTVALDGTGDTDHDGVSDGEEISAGTDPLLPDAIRVNSIARNEVGSVTLTWTDVPGRYSIESSPDLRDWTEIKTIDSNNYLSSTTVPTNGEPQCFFRIRRN